MKKASGEDFFDILEVLPTGLNDSELIHLSIRESLIFDVYILGHKIYGAVSCWWDHQRDYSNSIGSLAFQIRVD